MTIEHLGEVEVNIRDILCGADFPERLKRINVQKIAESAKDVGILQPPMVRASDMQLIFGGDRVASYVLNRQPRFVVKMVECDDETVAKIREIENSHRRETAHEIMEMVQQQEQAYLAAEVSPARPHCDQHKQWSELCEKCWRAWKKPSEPPVFDESATFEQTSYDSLRERMGDVTEAIGDRLVILPAGFVGSEKQPAAPKRGRPKKLGTKAREAVAEATGRSPEAIRKATERAKAAEAKVDASKADSVFELWGTQQPAAWLDDLLATRQKYTAAAAKLATAQGILKQAQVEVPELLTLWEGVRMQAAAIRHARPAAVCAWCKNLPTVVRQCKGCQGRGWLSDAQLATVPEKLREPRQVEQAEEDFSGSEVFE